SGDSLQLSKCQPINDSKALPLIAVREFIISRKSLGGIKTDLQSRVLDASGQPIAGLYAVGEAAGFGGGGVHGLRALEGTFLGGCILSGRIAAAGISGRALSCGGYTMKRTGAWLTVYALEQIGARFTFGIPGVHTTELYDTLNNSNRITQILVTHEGGASFMADAVGRLSDSIGVLTVVPAAGLTHAASGIGEAFLDGVPMLVLSGGPRTDTGHRYQLHQMDTHKFMGGLTKATFRVTRHDEVVPVLFEAYKIATSGEPGPVFVELPVNILLMTEDIGELPQFVAAEPPRVDATNEFARAVELL